MFPFFPFLPEGQGLNLKLALLAYLLSIPHRRLTKLGLKIGPETFPFPFIPPFFYILERQLHEEFYRTRKLKQCHEGIFVLFLIKCVTWLLIADQTYLHFPVFTKALLTNHVD